MQRVALEFGYPEESTMYSWRKGFAASARRAVGADDARHIMGHAAGTRVLEDNFDDDLVSFLLSYDEGAVNIVQIDVDVVALALGGAQNPKQILESLSQAVH